MAQSLSSLKTFGKALLATKAGSRVGAKLTSIKSSVFSGGGGAGGGSFAAPELNELSKIRVNLLSLLDLEKEQTKYLGDRILKFSRTTERQRLKKRESSQEAPKDKPKNKSEILKNPVVKGFFKGMEGLFKFFGHLTKIFVAYKILEWASKPENTKKITRIVDGITGIVKFFINVSKVLGTVIENSPIGWAAKLSIESVKVVFNIVGGVIRFFGWIGESLGNIGDKIQNLYTVFNFIPQAIDNIVSFFVDGIPKFLEQILTEGLFGSTKDLQNDLQSSNTAAPEQTAPTESSGKSEPAKVNFGELIGDKAKDVIGGIGKTLLNTIMPGAGLAMDIGSGIVNSVKGLFGGGNKEEQLPKLAKGGIVTKPTKAIVGEAGPEAILPLDKLGSFMGLNKSVGDVIPKFMKLLTVPFTIIGAGIVALISTSLSKIPGIGPLLMPLIGSISSAFGLPPSIISGIGKFAGVAMNAVSGGVSGIAEMFGLKEPTVNTKAGGKFTPTKDTSIRGLLANILGVLVSKLPKEKETTTPPPAAPAPAASSPTPATPAPAASSPTPAVPAPAASSPKPTASGAVSGSGVGDKIPALLEPGEYVLNKNAVKGAGGPKVLDRINNQLYPRFGSGGPESSKKFMKLGGGWVPVPDASPNVVVGRGLEHGYVARDLPMPVGTPLLSPFSGKIHEISKNPGGWGNYLVIKSDTGTYSLFGHVSQYTKKQGESVKSGEQVAMSGHQHGGGRSTGPHLHWEIGSGWNGTMIGKVEPLAWTQGKATPSVSGQTSSTTSTDANSTPSSDSQEQIDAAAIAGIAKSLGNFYKAFNGGSSSTDIAAAPTQEPKITSVPTASSSTLQNMQKENNKIQSQSRTTSPAAGGNVVTLGNPNQLIQSSTTQPMSASLGGTTVPLLTTFPVAP